MQWPVEQAVSAIKLCAAISQTFAIDADIYAKMQELFSQNVHCFRQQKYDLIC